MPILINCLPHLTHDQAWQVEDVLYRLGGQKVPLLPPGDDAAARRKYRDERHAWWKEHGAKADLALLEDGPRRKVKMLARASHSRVNPNGAALCVPDNAIDGDQQTS